MLRRMETAGQCLAERCIVDSLLVRRDMEVDVAATLLSILALISFGCEFKGGSFIPGEPLDASIDAERTDASLDSGPDATPLGSFGPAERVAELDIFEGYDHASLTEDQLEVFIRGTQGSASNIFVASRESIDGMFSIPQLVPTTNIAGGAESDPFISPNGLTLYFASRNVTSAGPRKIYQAQRAARDAAFGPVTLVSELNSNGPLDDDPGTPFLSDTRIIISSKRNLPSRLWLSERADGDAPWGAPVQITSGPTNIAGVDTPHVLPSGDRIFYDQARTGDTRQLWGADLSGLAISNPTPIAELDTPEFDALHPWVSPDRRTIYFTRMVPGDNSTREIFRASR